MSDEVLELRVVTSSAAATKRVAAALGRELTPPAALALEGDLGAGKTTFVQGLVAALPGGAQLRVQSPTFALSRTYPTHPEVHHIDLYRLEDEDAARDLGLGEMISDPDALACIEWPERAPGLLPRRAVRIELSGSTRRRTLSLRIPAEVVRAPVRLSGLLKEAAAPTNLGVSGTSTRKKH